VEPFGWAAVRLRLLPGVPANSTLALPETTTADFAASGAVKSSLDVGAERREAG
jgi:hypothetical protein